MARNGSGTFSSPYPNFVSGTVISSTQVDANNSDIATALTQSIAVDGQSTVTGNLPMNAKKLTGLAVGAAATDSLNLGQAQAEAMVWCGTAGGSANAITLSPTPAITAYAAGQRFVWKASGSVNTGATTVAVSGLGTIALQDNGSALAAGQHQANKIFMGILDTTSTVQVTQVQISGTDPLIVTSLTVSGTSLLTGVTTHGDDVVSDTDSTDDLGTTSVRWKELFVDAITATDQVTATGFTGTLDGILGSGSAAAATVTTFTSTGIDDNADDNVITIGSNNRVDFAGGGNAFGIHLKYNAATSGVYIGSPSAQAFQISSAGGSPYLNIDSSGKVGIGLTAPAGILNVKGTGGDAMPATSGSTQSAGLITRLQQGGGIGSVMDIGGNGGSGSWIQVTESGNLAANYKLLLNPNGGNVGIGTTAPNAALEIKRADGTGVNSNLILTMANGSAEDGVSIEFRGATTTHQMNRIDSILKGADSAEMAFMRGNGSNGYTESMRIDSGGTLIIGATSTNATASLIELRTAANTALNFYMLKAGQVEMNMGFKASTDSNFYIGTGGSVVGNNGVYLANTGTSWVSNSDFRKKKNLSPIENALDKIANCRAMTGHFKHEADDVKKRPFLIAQDWVTALPEAVDQDTVDDDGVENLGLSYEGTIPLLVAAIKELREQNIALTNRITALEG